MIRGGKWLVPAAMGLAAILDRENEAMRLFAAALALTLCAASAAWAEGAVSPGACKVRDPDLAGSYRGGCKDGWAEGSGQARGKDSYVGEFTAGYPNGTGSYRWANGDVYDGDWRDDQRTGHGEFTWANGNYYDGEWLNSKRNGHGIYYWTNGTVYNGEWRDDAPADRR